MLRSDDNWIWDSWVADDGEQYHLFYLMAPRSLVDPSRRHTLAKIGHAVSTDLVAWTDLGLTLGPDPDGWDDLALWTGSTVRGDDGVWRMFYTAINTGGHGVKDQKVGVVESDDLHHWRRVTDHPVAVADPRWYKTLPEDPSASETWRDPSVFRDPDGDGWRMLITARAIDAAPNDDGVIAQARSHDLVHWEVGPPICRPGQGFGQLEVLQARVIDGQPLLVFTCHPQEMTPERIGKGESTVPGQPRVTSYSTWYVLGDSLTGPWDISKARPFVEEPRLFAAPLVQRRDGTWCFVGFRNYEPEGLISFDIIDPIPVAVRDDALVRVT